MTEEISTSQNGFPDVNRIEFEEKAEETKIYNYDDILKTIGVGRVQWIVILASGLSFLIANSELIGMGFIALAGQCDFQLSSTEKGLLCGASVMGNICSSYVWGYYADTKGRRSVILTSLLATNIITFISICVPNFGVFLFLRFCVGLSISGSSNVAYAYLGEFFTTQYRAIAFNYASIFFAIAIVYVAVTAWLVLLMDWSIEISSDFSFRPWRLLPLLYVLPGCISVLLLLYLPESPKILFSLGRDKEAYESLDWVCRQNMNGTTLNDIYGPKLKIAGLTKGINKRDISEDTWSCAGLFGKIWRETYPLFQRPLVWKYGICCIIMCTTFLNGISLSIWYPEVQNRLAMYESKENQPTVCDAMNRATDEILSNSTAEECNDIITKKTYVDCLLYGLISCICYVSMGAGISLLGRKVIFSAFLGIAGACGLLLLWIAEPICIVLSFSLVLVLSELCMTVTNGIVVDLIPTHLCGQAISICLMLGRLSSAFGTYYIASTAEAHCVLTFASFSGFSILCMALSILLPI